MIVDWLQIFVFCFFGSTVPGSPIALYIFRKSGNFSLSMALMPVFSIGVNFALLQILNYVGLKLDLRLIAGIEIAATVLGIALVLRRTGVHVRVSVPSGLLVASVAPAAMLGVYIWRRAFSGFVFLAANHDGFNHNRFIYRILETGSALTKDALIVSPFQDLGIGGGFYPLAWHSWVAVWSSSTGLSVPVSSLISVVFAWTVALPLGLVALAKLWAPKVQFLGVIAAVLSQVYPLVPGVPMTWGSMTSVIGIAFLPTCLASGVCMLRETRRVILCTFALVPITLFFIHTPEAISLLVLLAAVVATERQRLSGQFVRAVVLGLTSFLVPLLYVFREKIFDSSSLKSLWGAAHPSWEIAIGSFFMMNVNTQAGFTLLSILFVLGLLGSMSAEGEKWLVSGVFLLFLVYLTSGANSGVLSHFRMLTSPWYASYERTLWVVVPFASLVSAYPMARLLPCNLQSKIRLKIVSAATFCIVATLIMNEAVDPTISKIRSGPEVSAFIGEGDFEVIDLLDETLGDEKIAISFEADGSTYGYMYKGLRVTSGSPRNSRGELSDNISAIYQDIGDLCSSKIAPGAFGSENIGAVIFGKRGVWGQTIWTDSELRKLSGLRIVATGEFLTMAIPDFTKC